MSSRIPDTHAEAWSLLPWLANGRIQPSEREWVEAHVDACAECREELAAQRVVAARMFRDGAQSSAAVPGEQRAFDKLAARIEVSESAMASPDPGAPARPGPAVRWLTAAVVVQGFGLALFGIHALRQDAPAQEYLTVTSVPAAPAQAPAVRIVFAPDASLADVNTLLAHQGLSIVSGPGASGNFTAELSAESIAAGASAAAVAEVISRDPNVSFAQPVAR